MTVLLKNTSKVRFTIIGLICCIAVSFATGCHTNNDKGDKTMVGYTSIYSATDDLGRRVMFPDKDDSAVYKTDKHVGLFYFLWMGEGTTEGPYDVTKILEKDPNAAQSNESWLAAGGAAQGKKHWWGEPIFGYFRSTDPYVAERDVQMLTDAGVDFLVIDYSNGGSYPRQLDVLLKTLDKYAKQGFNVPKISFVTKANSGKHIMQIYKEVYLNYPEYDYLWYRYDEKPLIIGNVESPDITAEARAYFKILYALWPSEMLAGNLRDDGFPWIDLNNPQLLFGVNQSKTVMSVSVAQGGGQFSSSAFYGNTEIRTRNYHNGANDMSTDAVLHGYSFAEQFENAISQSPDIVFITGWNEWIATRQWTWKGIEKTEPVILVDNANIDSSRDIQPMKGGYGDNYYMQMCDYIRKFKGFSTINNHLDLNAVQPHVSIDVTGDFSQWDQVEAYYIDYTEDTALRNHRGFGRIEYNNDTGRNDLYKFKVTDDGKNVYFYAQTVSDIIGMDSEHCMSLFLSTGTGECNWYGYDYVIGRVPSKDGKLILEQRTKDGWQQIGAVSYALSGNKIQIMCPLDLLGYSEKSFSLEFKWADNYQGEDDFWSFYLDGDCAPYGRFNYVYKA